MNNDQSNSNYQNPKQKLVGKPDITFKQLVISKL